MLHGWHSLMDGWWMGVQNSPVMTWLVSCGEGTWWQLLQKSALCSVQFCSQIIDNGGL